MDKTKFYLIDNKIFPSKLEAQFYQSEQERNCSCQGEAYGGIRFDSFNHRCSYGIKEINMETILKDRKYRKFLDAKLLTMIELRNEKAQEQGKIEADIEEIRAEQSKI